MQHNNFEIRVLIKGRPIDEYRHNGQTFIEGRAGSNFEIEFINHTSSRVEAILSVDGLSVIDGKEAGPNSAGYAVDAHDSVRIPGWKLTDEQVAAFVFAGKGESYATQSTGSAHNTGVIGALVFLQKSNHNAYFPSHNQYWTNGVLMNAVGSSGGGVRRSKMSVTPVTLENTRSAGGPISMNHVQTSNAMFGVASASATLSAPGVPIETVDQTLVTQNLGTGFGSATDFATSTVSFERGDLGAMIVLYYDDSRGLKARGIELQRPSRQRRSPANAPQAFPGMNCVPPVGWKG